MSHSSLRRRGRDLSPRARRGSESSGSVLAPECPASHCVCSVRKCFSSSKLYKLPRFVLIFLIDVLYRENTAPGCTIYIMRCKASLDGGILSTRWWEGRSTATPPTSSSPTTARCRTGTTARLSTTTLLDLRDFLRKLVVIRY